jgi:hypothetical protein
LLPPTINNAKTNNGREMYMNEYHVKRQLK